MVKLIKRSVQSLFYASVILAGVSCTKNEDPEVVVDYPDYIIFGRYNEMSGCTNESCVELFKLDTKGAYEDVLDNLPGDEGFVLGDFNLELTVADYNQLIVILERGNYEKLFDVMSSSVGSMQVGMDHYYFEYKSKERHQSWRIDGSFNGSIPPVVQTFLLDLTQMIQVAQF